MKFLIVLSLKIKVVKNFFYKIFYYLCDIMKSVCKYLVLLVMLLSVLLNISGKSSGACMFLPVTSTTDENRDFHFLTQDICPVDIFSKETNNVIPSTNYRLIPANIFVCNFTNNLGVKLPKVYKDVITFDIDNLALLGRNHVVVLRKLRI